ncbi:putative secreted protein [Rhodoligotrophos appendicifer]|uniref:DUF1467 family protein n=1 Tax=Rhodoligotrophos appendicifer TaxID=987056 RepID=UPI001185D966|nr:DUF1467 family protein [Rhodoligotrophos appendicifer]
MNFTSGIAIYFIIWWLVLFTVLPFGAYSPHQLDEDGTSEKSQPSSRDPQIFRKFTITTVIASVVFIFVYLIVTNKYISLLDIPFLESLRPYS